MHFGGGVGRIQLQGRPFIMYLLSEGIQLKVLIAQGFTDTDALLHGAFIVVNMVFFGKLYQFDEERRDYHSPSGMYPADGIPLKFGDAVAYTNHSHAQFAGAHVVGEPCHEAAVDGSHQLQDILFGTSGGGKRQVFVVRQPVQIFGSQNECYRIA